MSVISPNAFQKPEGFQEHADAPAEKSPRRVRLDYLDGLRGLAALYVVSHHAYMEMAWRGDGGGMSVRGTSLTYWLYFGQAAVDVFIVLSGYCLMIPVAQNPEGLLRGGAWKFFQRRARRILPPYYAALLLTLLLITLVPAVRDATSVRWPGPGPAVTLNIVVSHLLLVHNLNHHWAWAIDYPMWSVATEWQIYFLFPVLLLPVWRRFGLVPLLILSFGLGIGVDALFPRFDQAAPWMLGLFGLGMTGAVISFSATPALTRIARDLPWSVLGIAVFALYCCSCAQEKSPHSWNYRCLMDGLMGLATVCLLIFCTHHLRERPQEATPAILHLLQSRVAVGIGVFSYSLYLVHAPILALTHWAVAPLHLPGGRLLAVLTVCGTGASLVFAYLFHRLFERPFMPGHPKTGNSR